MYELQECAKCGQYKVNGRCTDCSPALPAAFDSIVPYQDIELVRRRPMRVDVRPIEPLEHVGQLAPFTSRSSLRRVERIVLANSLISSQTCLGMTWLANCPDERTFSSVLNLTLPGIISNREATGRLIIVRGR